MVTSLQKISGHLQIESEPGVDTTIRLPLTMAVIPSLVVRARAIWSSPSPRPTCWGSSASSATPAPARCWRNAGCVWPTGGGERRGRRADDTNVVVLRVGSNRYGLIVDQLFGTEEIVVKPLPRHTKDCRCFSEAAIMGDSRMAMILDAGGIAEHARLRFGEIRAAEELYREKKARQEASERRPGPRPLALRQRPRRAPGRASGESSPPGGYQPRRHPAHGRAGVCEVRRGQAGPAASGTLPTRSPLPAPGLAPLFAIIPKADGRRVGLVCTAI